MTLPNGWQQNRSVTELYTQRNISVMRRFHNHLSGWEACICKYRRQGLEPKEALHRASASYVSNMIHQCGIPKSMQWCGKPNKYDEICSVCNLLVKAGVLSQVQAGQMRYLGNFYAGREKVTQVFYDGDYEYTDDVSFPNYLDAWRCEVCGNEDTDGY
ncbi:hypothetical protein [Nostoc sp.]|uniref:hypothetical protein n=1 Tax=Nostoc sp. TaxID=1180 RepID=UPI002FFA5CAB